jgi:hypothetical protein
LAHHNHAAVIAKSGRIDPHDQRHFDHLAVPILAVGGSLGVSQTNELILAGGAEVA